MNSLTYNLEIIGERVTHTPNNQLINPILSSKKKIFQLNAKNGVGKTFILNLIAFALDTDKLRDDEILKSIKERIEDYNNPDYCKLDYTIELDLPDNNKLLLTKDANGAKRIQINGGAPIGYNQLHKDFSVIYDVPRDPSERLKGVVKDLKKWNDNLADKFNSIRSFLKEVTENFDNVRDQEKINRLKTGSEFFHKKI